MKSSCCGGVTTPALSLSGAGTVCPVPMPPLPAVNQSVFLKGKGEKGDPGDPGPPGLDGVDGVDGEDGDDAELPPGYLESQGKLVMTWDDLIAAIAADEKLIQFANDITMGGTLNVPEDILVKISPFHLVQSGANTVSWLGPVPHERVQIFEGFTENQIKGTFGSDVVYPEWWGLVGSGFATGQHDIAINCAIRAAALANQALNISLAARKYFIAKPLDLRTTSSHLTGAGAAATGIYASKLFDPGVWEGSFFFYDYFKVQNVSGISDYVSVDGGQKTQVGLAPGGSVEMIVGEYVRIAGSESIPYNGVWKVLSKPNHYQVVLEMPYNGTVAGGTIQPITLDSEMEHGLNAATAMIWIGAVVDREQSFFTSVRHLSINASEAVFKHPKKRIHGISWTGWVEECSVIHDVGITGFTGYGIGGESARNAGPETLTGITTINGLSISNFWITGGWRRYSAPIYIPWGASVCSIRDGTVDMTFSEAETLPGYIYPRVPPQYGIICSGAQTVVEGIHFESVHNAIHVFSSNAAGNVAIRSCTHMAGIDWPMRWNGDTANLWWKYPDPAAEYAVDNLNNGGGWLYHHSCFVSIGDYAMSPSSGYFNFNMVVTVSNLRSTGYCRYMLRDWAYNVHLDNWNGRFVNTQGRDLAFYARGVPSGNYLRMPYTAAATADAGTGAGSGTLLTVGDTTNITGAGVSLYPDTIEDAAPAVGYRGSYTIVSKTATQVLIQKPFTKNSSGMAWFNGKEWTSAAPLTDHTYFLGPVW